MHSMCLISDYRRSSTSSCLFTVPQRVRRLARQRTHCAVHHRSHGARDHVYSYIQGGGARSCCARPSDRLGTERMTKAPIDSGLLASPEYQAWLARQRWLA
jgi:hypothetical protein